MANGSKATIQFVDVNDGNILFTGNIDSLQVARPLEATEIVFNLQGLAFPHAGRYEFRLLVDNAFLALSVVNARK